MTPAALTPPPRRPVLLINPTSGGGKAARFQLATEAARRQIRAVVLRPGDHLRQLAQDAVAGGADALGIAGGDGSQALVADVAVEQDVPFVCVPAGTRNHFALDLGVDREDVVGALDAFTDGVERRVDVARVSGRMFVNNVSLGLYGKMVQSPAYRHAKLQTALEMLPDLLGPDPVPYDLRFAGPDGVPFDSADLVLVSNNPYTVDWPDGFGRRLSMATGMLGIVALRLETALEEFVVLDALGRANRFSGWLEWSAREFEIQSGGPVEAGVDGEALLLPPPLRFEVLPAALQVRVSRKHLGASVAQAASRITWSSLAGVLRAARGTGPEP